AEDVIRDRNVTGVQTCALPILKSWSARAPLHRQGQLSPRAPALQVPLRRTVIPQLGDSRDLDHEGGMLPGPLAGVVVHAVGGAQIGRASCRESVWGRPRRGGAG